MREAFVPFLANGWRMFFNVEHPAFGDIDMLLLCPAGVFVIDAKSHRGTVSQDPQTGTLLRDEAPFEKDFRRQLGRQADHVRAVLGSALGGASDPRTVVQTMICFTRARLVAEGPERPRGAFSLGELPRLLAWTSAQSPVFGPEEISSLAGHVRRAYKTAEAA